MNAPVILFVEDDESIQEFVGTALIDEGYQVLTAPNGVVALDLVVRRPPSLILLDLRMPIMDGWEFMRRYQAMPPPHAPVIALTASHHNTPTNAPPGVDGFLAKPFDLNELIALVHSHVRATH